MIRTVSSDICVSPETGEVWRREAGRAELVSPCVLCIVPGVAMATQYPAQLPHVLQPPHTGLAVPEPRRPAEARGGWAGQVGGAGCGVTCVHPVRRRCHVARGLALVEAAGGGRAQEAAVGGTRPSPAPA